MFFIFCTTDGGWWGNLEVFGQRSGAKALIFMRLLYIMVIGFFIGFIPSWKLKKPMNYMLCIIASGCFFSGASAARWWRLECKRLFCLLQKVWQKKTTAGWIVRKPTKIPCKPRGTRGGNFWRLVILPCGAARNELQGEAWPLVLITLYWHSAFNLSIRRLLNSNFLEFLRVQRIIYS